MSWQLLQQYTIREFNFYTPHSDLKYKIKSPTPVKDKKISKPEAIESIDNSDISVSMKDKNVCKICNLMCRGERGLRLVCLKEFLFLCIHTV